MTPTQLQAYLLWLNGANPPGSLGDAFLGGPWPLGFTQGLVLTPEEFGAAGDDVTDDTNAITTWIAQVLATGLPGYMRHWYKCTSQIYINLSAVASSGITIYGTGPNNCGFDLSSVGSANALLIGGSTANYFFNIFGDFGVRGNVNGQLMTVGHETYIDPVNSCIFRNINIKNNNSGSSACALELNYNITNSFINITANCDGHGDALRCNQVVNCTFVGGSFSSADIGIHFNNGEATNYNFSDTWLGVDVENVGVCVQSDAETTSKQTFIGGQFVWSGAAAIVVNALSNYITLIGTNPGVSGTYVSGAAQAQVLWADYFQGTNPFGGIEIAPASGTDAVVQLNAAVNQAAELQLKTGGTIEWAAGMNNASPSSFLLTRYSAGSSVDNPIAIAQNTGIVQMVDGVQINGIGPTTGNWSVWGSVNLTAQPSGAAANPSPSAAGGTNEVFQDTTFTGGIGSTAYALPDLVYNLKLLGLIAQ